MSNDIVARWKDPLFATDGDAEGASPVGQIEVAPELGGMKANTLDMFTYGCCEGGSWFDGTYGCCL